MGVNTRYQKEHGIKTTVQQVLDAALQYHHFRCDPAVLRVLIEESERTINEIQDMGVEFRGIRTMYGPEESLMTWHLFVGGAAEVIKRFVDNIKARGGELLTQTTAQKLIVENGTVCGVEAMNAKGDKLLIRAKKVIIATGGFAANKEMLAQHVFDSSALGMVEPIWLRGPVVDGRTGDGIKMVEDVGAKLWHMDMAISMYSMWTRDPEYDFSILFFMPAFSYFNVNRLGKRFVNENNMGSPHNGWHTLLSFDDSIADFDRIPSWGIFDQSCFDAGKLSTSQGDFFECGNFASDLPDSVRDWDGWSQDNKAELERGWILTGATIEELGQKIKEFDPLMDVDTLKATFEEYQGFAAAGKDARFDRAAETMVPLDNGPYYAVSIYPGSCSTLGGPMKNENAQVLDPAQNPIPRLYAAGCFGNFQSHSYGITGGNNAENQVWGRIAARHASGLENWDAE